MTVRKIYVDCLRAGQVLKSYEFGLPIGMLLGTPPSQKFLEDQAKEALTNDRLAVPPYEGIKFTIR